MKKVYLFALVLLIGIAFVSTGFAQEKAKPAPAAEKKAPEKAPAPEKKAPEKAKPAAEKAEPAKEEKPAADTAKPAEKPKPKPIPGFVGKVTVTESVYKTVSVERGKEVVTFDVSDAKFKGYKSADNIGVGDKIAMKYDKKGKLTVTKIAGAKKAKAVKGKVAKPKKREERRSCRRAEACRREEAGQESQEGRTEERGEERRSKITSLRHNEPRFRKEAGFFVGVRRKA